MLGRRTKKTSLINRGFENVKRRITINNTTSKRLVETGQNRHRDHATTPFPTQYTIHTLL